MNLSPNQVSDLIRQHRAADRGELLYLDIVMPNGKPLGDCTLDYLYRLGNAMMRYAKVLGRDDASTPVDAG
jgi:hypothetical protein